MANQDLYTDLTLQGGSKLKSGDSANAAKYLRGDGAYETPTGGSGDDDGGTKRYTGTVPATAIGTLQRNASDLFPIAGTGAYLLRFRCVATGPAGAIFVSAGYMMFRMVAGFVSFARWRDASGSNYQQSAEVPADADLSQAVSTSSWGFSYYDANNITFWFNNDASETLDVVLDVEMTDVPCAYSGT